MLNLTNIIHQYPFFLYYKGNYRDNLTLSIVDIVNTNLGIHYKKSVVNKLSYLVVEALQNIERYSQTRHEKDDFCCIFSDGTYFHVVTQNKIENNKIEALKKRLDEVNSKNEEELNKIYMSVLVGGELTEKGAGLGLIDMARKTKNNLVYEFIPFDHERSYYQLHLKIATLNDVLETEVDDNAFELAKELNNYFSKSINALFYAGDFSNLFLNSLLNMLSKLKIEDQLYASSIFKYGIIELSQNIKRHAQRLETKIPAFLCIQWLDDFVKLSTENGIDSESMAAMESKLNRLNRSSLEALVEESEEFMTDFSQVGGLGLIDIARLNYPNKINYSFNKSANLGDTINLSIHFNYGK